MAFSTFLHYTAQSKEVKGIFGYLEECLFSCIHGVSFSRAVFPKLSVTKLKKISFDFCQTLKLF